MSDIAILRQNLLGGMNAYVRELGDEDLWEYWIEVFPDECDEDTLAEIAADDDLWYLCNKTFMRIVRAVTIASRTEEEEEVK